MNFNVPGEPQTHLKKSINILNTYVWIECSNEDLKHMWLDTAAPGWDPGALKLDSGMPRESAYIWLGLNIIDKKEKMSH